MATCYRHPGRETGVSCSNCGNPICPYVLIGINVLLFLGSGAGGSFVTGSGGASQVFRDLALWGPAIDVGHDYWRLVTAGFLHSGLLHIGFNMYILYWLGTMLVSPNAVPVGAWGAVFGLMGAAFVMQRARGIDPMQSGIGPVILLNLVISFVIPNISIGGHIGGLVGGAAAAFAMERLAGRRPGIAMPIAACVAVGAIAVVAAIAVSGRS